MTDKKLSQLPAGTTVADADLFYSAQVVGAGFTQVQQPAASLKGYMQTALAGTFQPIGSYQPAGSYQPLDADLTAIAALAGTNTIYYQSGPGAWTPVTIGGGLTFSAPTLSVAAGGTPRSQRSVTNADISAGAFSASNTDQILNCNISSVSPICNLPSVTTRVAGLPLTIKDVGSQALVHNITITPNGTERIDGMVNYVLANNRASVTLTPYNDGTNSGWMIA